MSSSAFSYALIEARLADLVRQNKRAAVAIRQGSLTTKDLVGIAELLEINSEILQLLLASSPRRKST